MSPQELAEYTNYLKSKGFGDDDVKAYLAEKGIKPPDSESLGQKALKYGLRGLDYTGGLTRYGLASGAEALSGADLKLPNIKDVLTAQADVPMTEDLLARGNVLNDYPGTRKALGFAGDVVADPVSLLTLGAAGAGKAGAKAAAANLAKAAKVAEYANPVGKAIGSGVQKLGAPLYESAFKNIDTRLVEKGQDPLAPYLMKQDFWGGNKALADFSEKRMQDLAEARAPIYQEITNKGITIDPQAASQKAYEGIGELAQNPYAAPKVEAMMDYLALAKEPLSVEQASKVKSSLYDMLPATAFDPRGNLTNDGKKMLRDLSVGYKTEIEKAAEFARPGMGQELADLNNEWGSFIASKTPTASEIAKEGRKNILTETKAALLGFKPTAVPLMYAAKATNSPAVRSAAGLAIHKLGDSPAANQLWKQLLLGSQDQGEY